MTLADIVERCETARIPFSPIARPEDLFDDPHLNEGGSLVEAALPDGRHTKLPRLPLAIDGERFDLVRDAPDIGADTGPLLAELGYSPEQIRAWHEAEIVVGPERP